MTVPSHCPSATVGGALAPVAPLCGVAGAALATVPSLASLLLQARLALVRYWLVAALPEVGAGGGASVGVAVVAHLLVRVVAGRGGVVGLGRIAGLLHVARQLVKGIRVGVVRLGVGGLPPAWRTGHLSAGLAVVEVGLWPGLLLWDGLQTVAGQATVAPRASVATQLICREKWIEISCIAFLSALGLAAAFPLVE